MAEKARLTYEYMDYSLKLYRQTRKALRDGLEPLRRKGIKKIAIYGTSEALELTYLTLRELGLEVIGVISRDGKEGDFLGVPLMAVSDLKQEDPDLIIVASFPSEILDLEYLKENGFPENKIFPLVNQRSKDY